MRHRARLPRGGEPRECCEPRAARDTTAAGAKLAIVGMAARFGTLADLTALERAVHDGGDGACELPPKSAEDAAAYASAEESSYRRLPPEAGGDVERGMRLDGGGSTADGSERKAGPRWGATRAWRAGSTRGVRASRARETQAVDVKWVVSGGCREAHAW